MPRNAPYFLDAVARALKTGSKKRGIHQEACLRTAPASLLIVRRRIRGLSPEKFVRVQQLKAAFTDDVRWITQCPTLCECWCGKSEAKRYSNTQGGKYN